VSAEEPAVPPFPAESVATADPTFRVSEPVVVADRNGRQLRMQTCYDLVEGRWEPFESIRPL